MAICVSAAAPCILLPWLLESRADGDRPWTQKYWVKANVWIAIYSFVGNYFWSHYFYKLLGAAYTFPSWRLNDVSTAGLPWWPGVRLDVCCPGCCMFTEKGQRPDKAMLAAAPLNPALQCRLLTLAAYAPADLALPMSSISACRCPSACTS